MLTSLILDESSVDYLNAQEAKIIVKFPQAGNYDFSEDNEPTPNELKCSKGCLCGVIV
jgi:hypothetical protein